MGKEKDEMEKCSVTLSIYLNGKRKPLTSEEKANMRDVINKCLKSPAECRIETPLYTTSIFKRGKKPKKFTDAEAAIIREDTHSVSYKAYYYGASETTIWNIMKGRY